MWLGSNDVGTGTVDARPLPTGIPGDSASENACLSIGHRAVLRSQDVQLLPAEAVEIAAGVVSSNDDTSAEKRHCSCCEIGRRQK
jgi:hypothetical protein